MDLKVHPGLKEPLKVLCSDPNTTIVVLSGSDRNVLDEVILYIFALISFPVLLHPLLDILLWQNFGEYDMWLAAEHGMFLRLTKGEWMTTMPEHLNMEWVDSVMVSAETVFLFNFVQTQNLWCLCHVFSMYWNTSRKELPDHILIVVQLHLYGITNMQVPFFWFAPFSF